MNQFVFLFPRRRVAMVLSMLLALILVAPGCAPAPAASRASAPLQLLVFYSPL